MEESALDEASKRVNLEIKVIFSDFEFEVIRVGCWELTRTKEGECFWIFIGKEAQWQASPTKESLIQALRRLSKRSAAL